MKIIVSGHRDGESPEFGTLSRDWIQKIVSNHRAPNLPRYRPAHVRKYTSQTDALHLRHPAIAYRRGDGSNPAGSSRDWIQKICIGVGVFFIFFTIWMPPKTVLGAEFWSVRSNRVNIRKGPGKRHAVLYLANNGYPVRMVSHAKSWFKIKDFHGETGWIHKNFIRRTRYVIVSAGEKDSRINVREKGNIQSRIIAKASYSSVFKYIKKEKGWVNVQHDSGITGWIRDDLVWGD